MGYGRQLALCVVIVSAFVVMVPTAFATPFDFIRIGDIDGFGSPLLRVWSGPLALRIRRLPIPMAMAGLSKPNFFRI